MIKGMSSAWLPNSIFLEAVQAGKELNKTTAEEIMTTEVVTADVDTPS
jgi:hypothetical protein